MKKLLIAAAIVCAAAMSQAASISWEATGFTELASCEGFKGWGEGWTGAGHGNDFSCIQMIVWEFSQDDWTGGANKYMDGATLYADYKNGVLTGGKAEVYSLTNPAKVSVTSGKSWEDAQIVNAAILFLHSDAQDYANADYYMANYGTQKAADTVPSVQNLGKVIGGNGMTATSTATTWQSVPEPTSGLLLLLGVAGLALRRRRA